MNKYESEDAAFSSKQDAARGLLHLVKAATSLSKDDLHVSSTPKCRAYQQHYPNAISDEEDTGLSISSEKNTSPNESRTLSYHSAVSINKEIFPQRLMRILSAPCAKNTIEWLNNGIAFVILQPDVFTNSILPKYFPESCAAGNFVHSLSKQKSNCKYPSFTRKLNRWGFRQISRGAHAGAFHHILFTRDKPSLCANMVCHKSHQSKNKAGKSEHTRRTSEICVPGIYHIHCNGGVNVSNSYLSSMQVVSTVSDTDTASLSSQNELSSMQARSRFSTPLKKRRHCEITSLNINEINVLHNSPPSPKAYASSKYNPLLISPSLSSNNNGTAAFEKIFDGTVMSKQSPISSTCHNKSLTCTPDKKYLSSFALAIHNRAMSKAIHKKTKYCNSPLSTSLKIPFQSRASLTGNSDNPVTTVPSHHLTDTNSRCGLFSNSNSNSNSNFQPTFITHPPSLHKEHVSNPVTKITSSCDHVFNNTDMIISKLKIPSRQPEMRKDIVKTEAQQTQVNKSRNLLYKAYLQAMST